MEFRIALDALLLVDGTIFSQAAQLRVVQDSWDDRLSYDSVSTIVDDCGGKEVQFVDLKELERAETRHVMVGLSPTWVVVGSCEILEVLHDVKSVTEEDIVVDKHLAFCRFIGVKSSEIALNNSNGSLSSSLKEVVVNLLYSSVPLCSLWKTVHWEVLDKLILFVPISDSSRVQAVERIYNLCYGCLVAHLILLPFFKRGPMIHL